jgi:LuxR family maltose regulon positive regulatory protein
MTAVTASNFLLLPTKMASPQPGAGWIARERLLVRLGAWPLTKLTLLVAPAGFGKSTLVTQWLQQRPAGHVAAWLTLDAHDQDGLRVMSYLAATIEQALGEPLPTISSLLHTAEAPPLYAAMQALLIDLSRLAQPLLLVLDDYHTITTESVHQVLIYLVRHLPAHCRIVLISRVDPPLALARLRAEQQIVEVRAADLRFTEAEAQVLSTQMLGTVGGQSFALMYQQTEGWAIALQLALLAQRTTPNLRTFSGLISSQLTEYLTNELFSCQPQRCKMRCCALLCRIGSVQISGRTCLIHH